MMGEGYKKHDTVNVNGRNRVIFVKANSKSKTPILYIKCDKEYITYKSFLRKRKVTGGTYAEGVTHPEISKDTKLKPLPRVNIYDILINIFTQYKNAEETITLDLTNEKISKLFIRTEYLFNTTDHKETLKYDTDITKTINEVIYTFRIWKNIEKNKLWFQITSQNVTKVFVFNIQNKTILLEHIAPRTNHKEIF